MGQGNACLGLLTLGQTPRLDIAPTIRNIIGDDITIIEAGGLDGLSPDAIAALAPLPGENPIETRLSFGKAVLLSKERLLPNLLKAGLSLLDTCRKVLLLCSGEFPTLTDVCPEIILPAPLLRGVIKAVAGGQTLGVIGPATDIADSPVQWSPFAKKIVCAAASPYDPLTTIEMAGRQMALAGADIILLDDMAFTDEHRRIVSAIAEKPVICATTVTARVIVEML